MRQRQQRALTSESSKKKSKKVSDSGPQRELDASQLHPTHSYNMCVLEDMVVNAHFQILSKVFNEHCAVATDIVVLLKVSDSCVCSVCSSSVIYLYILSLVELAQSEFIPISLRQHGRTHNESLGRISSSASRGAWRNEQLPGISDSA